MLEKTEINQENILLEGFPSNGLVGIFSISYLIHYLKMEKINEFDLPDLPPVLFVENGELLGPIRAYRHNNIFAIISDDYNTDMSFEPVFVDYDEIQLKERALTDMKELKENANNEGVQVTKKVVKTLSTSKTLVELSSSSGFDLMIMGSHGRNGLNKFVFGSITNKVTPLSHCPIMIVK